MTNPNYTHLAIVADRSGSMFDIETDMNGAIKALLDDQNKIEGTLIVDITIFDTQIEHRYTGAKVEEIEHPIIVPRGFTALNDALGSTITSLGHRLSKMDEDDRPGTVIVAVVTDGLENASREFSTHDVKELVEVHKKKWNWQFVFLGTKIDAFKTAGGYGIGRAETISFAPSSSGVAGVANATSSYLRDVRGGVSRGFTSAERAEAMEETTP